jgi:DNA-binding NarL/FixJ family response regulator
MARESQLIERDTELARLEALVDAAVDGNAAVAFVEGPAGIGKSRLLAAAREIAEASGVRVLAARASALERDLAFGVVRQLFDPLLVDPDARARWLTGAAAPAGRVFAPPEEGETAADTSLGALSGLYWLTANVAADAPLLLVVDDLHWCDPASLRFVAYLGRRLAGLRLVVAVASRVGEPDADARLIGEIAQDPVAVSLRPKPLTDAGAQELIGVHLIADADPAFVAACQHATSGNPLLLSQLLVTLAADGVRPDVANVDLIRDIGPRATSRIVELRLAGLPADAAAVGRAISVLGDGAGLPAIAALSGLDDDRVARAIRALVGAEILGPEPPLEFVHPVVRDAIYLELTPGGRELEHERAAAVLGELRAPPEQVATHLLVAPCRADPRVAALLRAAARESMRRGAPDGAAAYLHRALREPPPQQVRGELELELGIAEAMLNRPSAVEHLAAARALLPDPAQRIRAGHMLARMLLLTRPPDEAVAAIGETLAELPASAADERRALEALALWAGVAFAAAVPDASQRLDAIRSGDRPPGAGARMLDAVAALDLALRGGTAGESARLALAALDDGTLIAADPGLMAAVAATVLVLADRDEALDVWERALAQAHRLGSAFAVCAVNQFRGWTWLARGELAEAESALRGALADTMLVAGRGTEGMAYVTGSLARVLVERGDVAAARSMLAGTAGATPGSSGDALVRRARTELLLAEARWDEALAEAEAYRRAVRDVDNPAWAPWRSLQALSLDALGRTSEATELLEQELRDAERWGAPGALGRALRLLGMVQRGAGLETLERAIATLEDSPARLEHAKALAALGSALRRGRRPSDARAPLRRAVEIAERCGATPLADAARTELRAAGGRARHIMLSGPESLTPSERRVADLAADGLSNRDIAQTLFVTPKTVEVHLTSAYRKLDIATRRELAGALAGDA